MKVINMADSDTVSPAAVNVASKMDDDASDDRPAPRENMISNAVRFLQNPKVRESPFAQRKAFLAKKGLTSEEIELAISRSGTAADATAPLPTGAATTQSVVPVTHLPPPVAVSPWVRWRDRTATAIVIGGISYGIYQLLKYVLPLWLGPSEEERRAAALRSSIADLEQSVRAMVDGLGEMQKSFKEQQEQLRQVVLNTAANRGPVEYDRMQQQQNVSEIKGEIQSLKGLLLSRKQFPAAPKPMPVIPAWQLGGGSADTEATLTANGAVSVTEPAPVPAKGSTDTGATLTIAADLASTSVTNTDMSTTELNGVSEDMEVAQILKDEGTRVDPEPAQTVETSDIHLNGDAITMATAPTESS